MIFLGTKHIAVSLTVVGALLGIFFALHKQGTAIPTLKANQKATIIETRTEQTPEAEKGAVKEGWRELAEPLPVVWDGEVETLLTYGRYLIGKQPTDAQYPEFIAEFEEDGKAHEFEAGTRVRITGKWQGTDCYSSWGEGSGFKDGQCVPYVLIESIKTTK